ncbi:MAG: chorismate mutase [Planctomycetes bacterium]|nr:chorismate mutase [Planctomycetota bacterium]
MASWLRKMTPLADVGAFMPAEAGGDSGTSPDSLLARESVADNSRGAGEVHASVEHLLRLLRERLLLAHDIARAKWILGRTITDPAREQALLEERVGWARNAGLDSAFTQAFVTAQMKACKQIQQADFQHWQEARAVFTDALDLPTLRQWIDTLDRDLLATLAQALPGLATKAGQQHLRQQAPRILAGPGIDDEVRTTALAPLEKP